MGGLLGVLSLSSEEVWERESLSSSSSRNKTMSERGREKGESWW